MNKNEMTQKKAMEYVLNTKTIALPDDVREKLQTIYNSITKRSTTPSKKDKELAEANAKALASIIEQMEVGKAYTIQDIINGFEGMGEYSTAKVTSLLKPAIADNTITRTEVKGRAYFALPTETEEEEG